jgi:hypothetical protein
MSTRRVTLELEYIGPEELYSMRLKAVLKVLLRTFEFRVVSFRSRK